MRLIDLRLLNKVDHHAVFDQIRDVFAELDEPLSNVKCWVADGASVNGVQGSQGANGEHVWAMLRQPHVSPSCMRAWGVCHLYNLALKDQWSHNDSKDFLKEMDSMFRSMAKSLEMSRQIQERLDGLAGEQADG